MEQFVMQQKILKQIHNLEFPLNVYLKNIYKIFISFLEKENTSCVYRLFDCFQQNGTNKLMK